MCGLHLLNSQMLGQVMSIALVQASEEAVVKVLHCGLRKHHGGVDQVGRVVVLVLVRHLLQTEQVLLDLYILLILIGGHSVPSAVDYVQLKTSTPDDHSIALIGWHLTRHLVGQLDMAIA